ncbi:hypothetical protein BKA70DRAFT_1221427 [Coprinopsis sp. MPI-PUGE-AT-0042]|nr:hypothetical protein BKA70DRAFT_1221427 [Coprinopsis sp. MPI-PUGE-AT-0042]
MEKPSANCSAHHPDNLSLNIAVYPGPPTPSSQNVEVSNSRMVEPERKYQFVRALLSAGFFSRLCIDMTETFRLAYCAGLAAMAIRRLEGREQPRPDWSLNLVALTLCGGQARRTKLHSNHDVNTSREPVHRSPADMFAGQVSLPFPAHSMPAQEGSVERGSPLYRDRQSQLHGRRVSPRGITAASLPSLGRAPAPATAKIVTDPDTDIE